MRADTRMPVAVTGVILAGGRGRRMGGRDKGLASLSGRPLIEHMITALRPQTSGLIIIANRNLSSYRRYGYPVAADSLSGYLGPLAGMLTGLQQAATEWVLVVPCDVPGLPADLVRRMMAAIGSSSAEICIAHDGLRTHPVIALINRGLEASLRDHVLAGNRRVEDWVMSRKVVIADFTDIGGAFRNLNREDDLADTGERTLD
jgi:molybdopterin-guanine dinucleotide biosynthesis protein A